LILRAVPKGLPLPDLRKINLTKGGYTMANQIQRETSLTTTKAKAKKGKN